MKYSREKFCEKVGNSFFSFSWWMAKQSSDTIFSKNVCFLPSPLIFGQCLVVSFHFFQKKFLKKIWSSSQHRTWVMFVALISSKKVQKVLQTLKMAENRHLDGKIVFSSFLKTLVFQIYIIQKSAHKGRGVWLRSPHLRFCPKAMDPPSRNFGKHLSYLPGFSTVCIYGYRTQKGFINLKY